MGELSLAQGNGFNHSRPRRYSVFGNLIKLTPAQRDQIAVKRGEGVPVKELALEYGVSASYIYNNISKMYL